MAKRELTNAQAFARFDHDHDGRPGGSLPKKEATMAKTTTRKSTARTATKRADQAPEAKRTTADKSAAADKMFKDADEAALRGLPADMTRDQHETMVRRAALGY